MGHAVLAFRIRWTMEGDRYAAGLITGNAIDREAGIRKTQSGQCADNLLPLIYCRKRIEVCVIRSYLPRRRSVNENPAFDGDLGFRVFKLDTSNIRAWDPDRDDLGGALLGSIDHIRTGRSEEDILYELFLKLGLDLCVPIETRAVAGKTVRSIGAGTLIACLDENIAREEVEPLALGIAEWHDELAPAGDSTVVFRDSAFVDDVAKTNLTAILEQHGLANVRSL